MPAYLLLLHVAAVLPEMPPGTSFSIWMHPSIRGCVTLTPTLSSGAFVTAWDAAWPVMPHLWLSGIPLSFLMRLAAGERDCPVKCAFVAAVMCKAFAVCLIEVLQAAR